MEMYGNAGIGVSCCFPSPTSPLVFCNMHAQLEIIKASWDNQSEEAKEIVSQVGCV